MFLVYVIFVQIAFHTPDRDHEVRGHDREHVARECLAREGPYLKMRILKFTAIPTNMGHFKGHSI